MARDFELLNNSKFRWEDIDLLAIEDRTELLLLLNKPIPNLLLPIISARPFELFFPLKFLDLITERPNNWFGESVYNKSLDYYTCLFECFLQFYLEKDLCFLDKLESEDMRSYSLIGRKNVREKNQRNEEIKSRYFNDIFNLKNFALKLVRNFIPAATWRWIGANHKCHILSIKLCKILIEYQLLTLGEIEEVKSTIFEKIPALKSLENAVKRDSEHMSEAIVTVWKEGLMNIREYCAEILIQYCYYRFDEEWLYAIRKQKSFEGFYEEEENVYELREFLFFYLLCPVNININGIGIDETKLISNKTTKISVEILGFFSSVDDNYKVSLEFFSEKDYNCNKETINEIQMKVYSDLSQKISKIFHKTSEGDHVYRETVFVKQFNEILAAIHKEITSTGKENNYTTAKMLSIANIPNKILKLFGVYAEFSKEFKLEVIFNDFRDVLLFYVRGNQDFSSVFLNKNNLNILANLLNKFPVEISDFLYNLLKDFQLLPSKQFIIDIIFSNVRKFQENPEFENIDSKRLLVMRNMHQTISLFIDKSKEKKLHGISDNDLKIAEELEKMPKLDFQSIDEITKDTVKLDFFISFFQLCNKAIKNQILPAFYKKLSLSYPQIDIEKCITECQNNLNLRVPLLNFYSNLNIAFRSRIVNNRKEFYKGDDSEWEWDCGDESWSSDECDMAMKILWKETTFFFENFENEEKKEEIQIKKPENELKLKKKHLKNIIKGFARISSVILGSNDEKLKALEGSSEGADKMIIEVKMKQILNIFMEKIGQIVKIIGLNDEVGVEIQKKINKKLLEIEDIDKVFQWKKKKAKIEVFALFFIILEGKIIETRQKILKSPLETTIIEKYESRKKEILTTKKEKNILFENHSVKLFENSQHLQFFCHFLTKNDQNSHNLPKQPNYCLLESFTHAIRSVGPPLQEAFSKILEEPVQTDFLLVIFDNFKESLHFLIHQDNFVDVWENQNYKRILMILEFYREIARNSRKIKNLLFNCYTKKTPCLPFINILEKLMKTIIDRRMKETINLGFLLVVMEKMLGFFKEWADDCELMRHQLAILNPDLCKNFLINESKTPGSAVPKTKIMAFFRTVIQGRDLEISNFHSTNFEINSLYSVFLACFQENLGKFVNKELKDITTEDIMEQFGKNRRFSENEQFRFCKEVFLYFKDLSEVKSRYLIFFKEREENKKKHQSHDLAIFRFFNEISRKIEIEGDKNQAPISFYFARKPESYCLSFESRKEIGEEFKRGEVEKFSDFYNVECSRATSVKKLIGTAEILWISTILSIIALTFQLMNYKNSIIFFSLELLVSLYGLSRFYQGKFQILKTVFKQKPRLFDSFLKFLLSQKEIILLFHVISVFSLFLGIETFVYLDSLSFFVLIQNKRIGIMRIITEKSRAVLINCGFLSIFGLIYINFGFGPSSQYIEIFKQVLSFWIFSVVIFIGICPILIEIFQRNKNDIGKFAIIKLLNILYKIKLKYFS